MRIKPPTKEMAASLLEVVNNGDLVLVAAERRAKGERISGIFRLLCCGEGKKGEFSLLVGDPWQGLGVGARLYQYGLFLAKACGLRSIWGYALSKNKVMIHFARKLGFTLNWDTDMMAYEMRMVF